MRRIISAVLSVLTVASLLAACAPASDQIDPAITLASSDAAEYAEWLDTRVEEITDDVIIGIGSNEKYNIDMSNFEDDGYIARAMNDTVLLFGATGEGLDRAVREYAKAADKGEAHKLDTVYHEGERIEKLTIAGKDISQFTIVYEYDEDCNYPGSDDATVGNTQYAANELQRLMEQATGVLLPIKTDDVKTPMIKLGYLKDSAGDYDNETYGENGFAYEIKNGNVYINGASLANGVANGVYHFLQNQCGWDALIFGDAELQESESIALENGLSVSLKPLMDYLDLYYMGRFDFDIDRDERLRDYDGRVWEACHGIANKNWTGTGSHWYQICYTDESTYMNGFDSIYSHITKRMAAGERLGIEIAAIDISQGDCFAYCKCSGCIKIYREEGKVHSGAVVRWANRLAEEMEGEGLGGVAYLIFAYHGSNIPCKTQTREDVYVTFCFDGSCTNHPIDGSECKGYSFDMAGYLPEVPEMNNSHYAEWLAGWNEICENLYVWLYAMDHKTGQFPYFDNVYSDMMYLKKCGVDGMFFQADFLGFGYQRLRYQLIEEIMWNPDLTEEEYNLRRDEIMRREYGDGYELIQEYLGLLEQTYASEYNCWNCWSKDFMQPWIYNCELYSELSKNMLALIEEAFKYTSNYDQEFKLKLIYAEVIYRQCYSTYFLAYEQDDQETLTYLEGQFAKFIELSEEVGYLNDGVYDEEWDWKTDDLKLYTDIHEEAFRFWYKYIEEGLLLDKTLDRELPEKWQSFLEALETETVTTESTEEAE